MLADCSMECDAMAKPTKKKISPSATANNERKPRRSKIGADVDFDLPFEANQLHFSEHTVFPEPSERPASPDVLNRLWTIIESRKRADPDVSHSARLLARGTVRVAQKLGEEAIECLIEAMAGNRSGLIGESADVLYHLLVTWVQADIRPEEVWQELLQRERVSYLSEGTEIPLKRLLGSVQIGTSRIP